MMINIAVCVRELTRRSLLPDALTAVFVAGSLVRGWGNVSSDLDVYVVVDGPGRPVAANSAAVALHPPTIGNEKVFVDGRRWDVEYWLDSQVDQVLQKVSWDSFDTSHVTSHLLNREIDLVERLTHAQAVLGEDWLAHRREQLTASATRPLIAGHRLRLAHMFIEDAVGQMAVGDHESAVLSVKLAYGSAVDALLAAHGEIGHTGKWRARRLRSITQSSLSFDEYWAVETMRDYNPDEPEAWVQSVIVQCRRLALETST